VPRQCDRGGFFPPSRRVSVWAHSQQLINLVMKDERQASQTEQQQEDR